VQVDVHPIALDVVVVHNSVEAQLNFTLDELAINAA
jgi:hypothetical protein